MKNVILALFVSMGVFTCGFAHADSITGTITGDDNISYWNGSSWVAEGTAWQTPETLNLTVSAPNDIVYFAVSNNSWGSPNSSGNPAGFLASFTDNTAGGLFTQTGTDSLVSNPSTFEILKVPQFNANLPGPIPLSEINPPNSLNPSTLTGWTTPTSYASNGGGEWGEVNGGPLNSINSNAQWIWTANNDSIYSQQDDYAILGVNLGTDPVAAPEPPTLLLFTLAGAMGLLLIRKKLVKLI